MRIDHNQDGISHINVYSKGRTELGRLLSNFANTPFMHPAHGKFASVEGYWYWLSCKEDTLKELYGYKAKKVGRELGGEDWLDDAAFRMNVCTAITCKLEQNPYISKMLAETDLPLVHYYLFGNNYNPKVIVPSQGLWIINHIESIRADLCSKA